MENKGQEKFSEHFLLTLPDVPEYVAFKTDFFAPGARLSAEEIGDGNINYVFRVRDESGRSLVLKQADKFLRSCGRPLDLRRSKIEAAILRIEAGLAPGKVPQVYFFDETMCVLCLEDISDYKNLRTEMLAGRTFPHLAKDLADFLADTLLPTTDLVLDRFEKKRRVLEFANPEMCDISEDLVLTEPYYDYKGRNIITCGNEAFVEKYLYGDEDLKAEVGLLRNGFMNNAQALLHGDLHSGSIFVNERGLKVLDPEFAFYGPMGYDIGNAISNLFFALARACFCGAEEKFTAWVKSSIIDLVDLTRSKLTQKFDELVTFPLYTQKFRDCYIGDVLADSLGYAGTELIRRTVGDCKVQELSSLEVSPMKIELERALVRCGITLIKRRRELQSGAEVLEAFSA